MEEQPTHDAFAENGGPEPDPFAEVPSDPGLGETPPAPPPEGGYIPVSEGTLGGPPEGEQAPPPPPAEEPADAEAGHPAEAGEFMEEPAEADDLAEPLPPTEEQPQPEPEPEPQAEEPAAAPPEPPTPAEGEVATPVEGSGTPPLEGSLGPEESAAPESEPQPEPEQAEAAPPSNGAEPEGQPEEESKPKPKRRRRRKKKEEPGRRGYVILKVSDATFQHPGPSRPVWEEAFEREVGLGEDGSEPKVISSRSAEMALRAAYRELTDNGEGSFELVAVPEKLFRPKRVEGRVPETALTIKVG